MVYKNLFYAILVFCITNSKTINILVKQIINFTAFLSSIYIFIINNCYIFLHVSLITSDPIKRIFSYGLTDLLWST